MGLQQSYTYEYEPTTENQSEELDFTIVRYALLIGINYFGTQSELRGCINDCNNLEQFLLDRGYKEGEIVKMTDDIPESSIDYPTYDNIINNFANILKFANDNPDKIVKLFVSFSGHGAQEIDYDGDESDGFDEVICTVDNKIITDDTIRTLFINELPSNARLTVIIDACNSGTSLDLPYNLNVNFDGGYHLSHSKRYGNPKCKAYMISGCSDKQTSADAYIDGVPQGALTCAFLQMWKPDISVLDLIINIRKWLSNKRFSQYPQFSSTKSCELHKKYYV